MIFDPGWCVRRELNRLHRERQTDPAPTQSNGSNDPEAVAPHDGLNTRDDAERIPESLNKPNCATSSDSRRSSRDLPYNPDSNADSHADSEVPMRSRSAL